MTKKAITKETTANNLIIRHAEPSDLAAIRALYAEPSSYADTLQTPFTSELYWAKKLSFDDPNTVVLIALNSKRLLGQLTLEMNTRARRRHVATLGMGVSEVARGQGIGSALMRAALDVCDRWWNIQRVEIEVFTRNQAAIALYKKFGFVVEGTARMYAFRDGRYEDAHLMARIRCGDEQQ